MKNNTYTIRLVLSKGFAQLWDTDHVRISFSFLLLPSRFKEQSICRRNIFRCLGEAEKPFFKGRGVKNRQDQRQATWHDCIPSLLGNAEIRNKIVSSLSGQDQLDGIIKESLTRDFRLQVFIVNQCPPGPWVCHCDRFDFFRKFAEITANECLSGVSTTRAIKEKNIQVSILWRA